MIMTVRRPIRSASRPAYERADGAADQDGGDVEARFEPAQREGLLQPVLGAIDDATVVAEQEAAGWWPRPR